MDDSELDMLLNDAAPQPGPVVDEAATALLLALPLREQQHQQRRRAIALIAIPAGALALAAGGTWQAAQMQMPPFQTTEPGVVRVYEPVHYSYTDSEGTHHCQLFFEGTRLDERHIAVLRDAARDPAVAAAISAAAQLDADPGSPPPPGPGGYLAQAVWEAAHRALPELQRGLGGDPAQPSYNGFGATCR